MRAQDYSTVVAQGSPGYLAPLDPRCPDGERFMAVHLVSGGGWGIVDRRSGRLRGGPKSKHDRYATWSEVDAAIRALNTPAKR